MGDVVQEGGREPRRDRWVLGQGEEKIRVEHLQG